MESTAYGSSKTHHFHEIKPKLEEYLKKKPDVNNDEKQQVKLNNWSFDEGEKAHLTWISSPFAR